MSQSTRLLPVALLLACAATIGCGDGATGDAPAGGAKAASATGEIVAYVAGEPISMEEVQKAAASRLADLEQQRYDVLVETVEQLAAQKLVNKEAATRGVSNDDLFRDEIAQKVGPPTEQEIQAFWQQVKGQVGDQTLDSLRPRIEQQLANQKNQARMQAFIAELKARDGMRIAIDPPRYDVDVPAGEPAKGPQDAPVTLVEFSDFDCPFCKKAHPAVERILADYGDKIRFVYRDFPLPMHQRAVPAAEAARCAGEQGKYWEYFQHLMETQGDLSDADLEQRAEQKGLDVASFKECFQSRRHQATVQSAVQEGQQLGVTGTPTFFINGRRLVGAASYEQLKAIVDDELARAGQSAG